METLRKHMNVSNRQAIATVQGLLDDDGTTVEIFLRTKLQLTRKCKACPMDSVSLHISYIFKHYIVSCYLYYSTYFEYLEFQNTE